MPKSQRLDGMVAGSTKRLASRFYQLKTGHCLTGQYLNWTKNRPTPQCWWCRYRMQTRDHLFKECPEWKPQQKILWAEVKKETGRWRDRWKIRDLLAGVRCSRAVLDSLSSTDVGSLVPAEEEDAVSVVSEAELREWLEEQGPRGWEPGRGDYHFSSPRRASWRRRERASAGAAFFPLSFPFVIILVRFTSPQDRPHSGQSTRVPLTGDDLDSAFIASTGDQAMELQCVASVQFSGGAKTTDLLPEALLLRATIIIEDEETEANSGRTSGPRAVYLYG